QVDMTAEMFRHEPVEALSLVGPRNRMSVMPINARGGGHSGAQLRLVEPAMQVSTPDIAQAQTFATGTLRIADDLQWLHVGRGARAAPVGAARAAAAVHGCLPHVDLVGAPLRGVAVYGDLPQHLLRIENGLRWKEPKTGFASGIACVALGVGEDRSEHLEAAADPDHQ